MILRIIAIVVALAGLGAVLYLLFSKNQKPWDQMSDEEQRRKKTLVTGGILVFLAGLITAIFLGRKKQ
jgi:flagellar basal body-associated protein FliL